jgi:hypothetical protein
MSCRREALFESYVDMLHHHCSEAPGTYSVLREVLQRAIKEFPNNVYLLTMVAKLEVSTVVTKMCFYNTILSLCGRSHFLSPSIADLFPRFYVTIHLHYMIYPPPPHHHHHHEPIQSSFY